MLSHVCTRGNALHPAEAGMNPPTPRERASYLTEVPDWELRNKGRILRGAFISPIASPVFRSQRRLKIMGHLQRFDTSFHSGEC
jgi:hypothetical protein